MREPSAIGTVQDVDGSTVSVAIDGDVPNGLIFVAGEPYRVGQVGSFARISIGLTDLVGVVTRVGAGAAPTIADGEAIEARWLSLELVGESSRGRSFVRGVSQLPSVGDQVHVVTGSDLASIYGSHGRGFVPIGHVAAAEAIEARLDLDRLVTRHSAVVGSTGSGKSTTVSSIVQSISDPSRFPSARIVLFDMHGEYARALGASANVFTIDATRVSGAHELSVPFWALTFDELVPLLFGSIADDAGRAYVRDLTTELKRASFKRKSVAGLNKAEINADSPVPFSVRTLWFELHVLLNATHTAAGGQSQATWALLEDAAGNPIEPGDSERVVAPIFQTQTQSAGAAKVYLSTSPLNIRRAVDVLGSRLRDRRFDFALSPSVWSPSKKGKTAQDLDTLLEAWLGLDRSVTIVDLSGVPPAVATDIVGSMTRVIYDAMFWARNFSEGSRERPVLFIFEEAHAYLGETRSAAAKSAVQRIVREGRKYGMGAMIVSQRPSEIDPTILSQCGTLIAMRLTNTADRAHVSAAAADNLKGILSMLPILRTGEAIILGESVPLPMRALITLPQSLPDSRDPAVVSGAMPGGWDRKREPSDYSLVVQAWRAQNQNSPSILKGKD